MNVNDSAIILIGFQNDYFAEDGILRAVIDEPERTLNTLGNTISLIEHLSPNPPLIVETPIAFSNDYKELYEPVGILETIKNSRAFLEGTTGVEPVSELGKYHDIITTVLGKHSFNAFSNTGLDELLKSHQIKNVFVAGAVTSICIDSSGRQAHENGYNVTVLRDCTVGRTMFEHNFYCDNIFPLYASVKTHQEVLELMDTAA